MIKKKLLVFHKALAPYRIDLFNRLSEMFETDIYFFNKNMSSQNFDMNTLESQLNFKPKFLTHGFDLHHKGRVIRFGYLKKIIEHKPNLIICLEYSTITFTIALFAKLIYPKVKIYSICDDSVDVARNSSKSRKIGRFLCLKLLDGIILGNDFAGEWYKLNFPKVKTVVSPIIQKEERIVSILNDAQPITQEYIQRYNLESKNVLLFVGRLVEVKNLNFLLEVFSQYASTNNNVVLILVGDGDKKNELLDLAINLEIQEKVIFAGRFEHNELYAWYRIADYFILPSTSETFGAVVNESLIAGVPVLCSDLAGASSLINDKNGITFSPFNKEKLLSIFNDVFSKDKDFMPKPYKIHSLMPYTFNQRISDLISFLVDDKSE